MLAYVFWHWKRAGVPVEEYEARQRAFHASLAAAPSSGFNGSFSVALTRAPWAECAAPGEANVEARTAGEVEPDIQFETDVESGAHVESEADVEAADTTLAYEDWYLVDDFGAFGALNEAAVTSSRAAPHEAAASAAARGTAGVYALRLGAPLFAPKHAQWFGKPRGMSYAAVFAEIAPLIEPLRAALWMRQMVLGPAPEFCLHSETSVSLPAVFRALGLSLRLVWR